jgi:signal transduction histidine kinase
MMQEIKQSSVTLMEKMDDIVWSINPDNDTMENLMIRIRRFASRLFEARSIDYTIEIDTEIHHARPGMETRQHIYLIMKEIINNLVKYSGCTKAYIGVKYENKIVRIEIKDNGKGFDLREVKAGNGMISMVSRAKLIGAELKISSMPGEGSEFLLQTKIK